MVSGFSPLGCAPGASKARRTITEDLLRRELADAFRNRAHLYRLLFEELADRFGDGEAEAVLARVCERRGREVARAAFGHLGAGDARAVGEAFLAASPDGGRLYPTEVERLADGIRFAVRSCPLKSAWVDEGLAPDRVATLCRIAGAFDRGLFEATGARFRNRTWEPGDGPGCCRIELRDGS